MELQCTVKYSATTKHCTEHVTDLRASSHHGSSQALQQVAPLGIGDQHGAIHCADEVFLGMGKQETNTHSKKMRSHVILQDRVLLRRIMK